MLSEITPEGAKRKPGILRRMDTKVDVTSVVDRNVRPKLNSTRSLGQRSERSSGQNLEFLPFASAATLLPREFIGSGQEHEDDPAEIVIVCEPTVAKMMGALHPSGALYEHPVNLSKSAQQHMNFRDLLRRHRIAVLTVREILAHNARNEESVKSRMDLEDLAMYALTYRFQQNVDMENLSDEDKASVSDKYKRRVLECMGTDQLIDVVLTNPIVHLQPSSRDTGFTARYEFEPLTNLVFTRDQQVTTCKGIVMGSLRSQQRLREVNLMKFCFKKLGLTVLGRVQAPGYLEGGDFFAAGSDLCMVGIGLRSNQEAVDQCMDKDWFGTTRVAVVKDNFEQSQDRMHLDCIFSILSKNCCILLAECIGAQSPTRRLVDEFSKGEDGTYFKSREDIEFSQYLKDNGYHIIPISGPDQLLYGCNVLNLGNSNIVSVHADTARQICRDPIFKSCKGNVEYLEYNQITSMYGAVHCSSQVVKRTPLADQILSRATAGADQILSRASSEKELRTLMASANGIGGGTSSHNLGNGASAPMNVPSGGRHPYATPSDTPAGTPQGSPRYSTGPSFGPYGVSM